MDLHVERFQESNHKITFLTNHTRVLAAISKDRNIRMREMARAIGITERAVQRIVDELITAGYITAYKSGRRNAYALDEMRTLGASFPGCLVSDLLNICRE